jgi:hypothetical protein
MKRNEIEVQGVYLAKVSGRIARVKVVSIYQTEVRGRAAYRYNCINLGTNRSIVVRSAARFRGRA